MPRREIGLMGYIGEYVVEEWLRRKFSGHQYRIVREIMLKSSSRRGGGYLDFCVLQNGLVNKIYEVKSQDFIPGEDFVNQALLDVWNYKRKAATFIDSEENEYKTSTNFKAFVVLLVGPNKAGLKCIGKEHIEDIILFEDIWREIDGAINITKMTTRLKEDALKVRDILQEPTQGKRITSDFKKFRKIGTV